MTDSVNRPEKWSMLATRVLAPNPGAMTLEGTNSFVVRHPESNGVVIVDPGPRDSVHLRQLIRFGTVDLILLTHRHSDHTELARMLHDATGAPVRAADSALCVEGPPIVDQEEILAGGTVIHVVATPGHTADSVCFHLPHDRNSDGSNRGVVLTGDTILGRGTTVIASPDGSLWSYFGSLKRLNDFGSIPALPAHGPRIDDLRTVVAAYTAHRRARLRAVSNAVATLSGDRDDKSFTVGAITDVVYPDVASGARFAAEANVKAQLDYLAQTAVAGTDPFDFT